MITPDNIVVHELIGLETEIVNSSNKEILGLKGVIVDETKHIFVIKTSNVLKKIPKDQNNWKFSVQSKEIVLHGSNLRKRPFDRVGFKF